MRVPLLFREICNILPGLNHTKANHGTIELDRRKKTGSLPVLRVKVSVFLPSVTKHKVSTSDPQLLRRGLLATVKYDHIIQHILFYSLAQRTFVIVLNHTHCYHSNDRCSHIHQH